MTTLTDALALLREIRGELDSTMLWQERIIHRIDAFLAVQEEQT